MPHKLVKRLKQVAKRATAPHRKALRRALKITKGVLRRKRRPVASSRVRRPTRSPRVGSRSFPSGVRISMGVTPTPSDRGPRSRRQTSRRRRR